MAKPFKIDQTKLDLLRQAFLMGLTDKQACIFAGISPATLYNYQQKHPEYLEQKELFQQELVIKAKIELSDYLTGKKYLGPNHRINLIKWYLERKDRYEFSTRIEHTGTDNQAIKQEITLTNEQYQRAVVAEAERLKN